MVQASEAAGCKAYATEENARLRASRFVGTVQLRGARGRVWLSGRRVPTSWLCLHTFGRVTWGALWRAAAMYTGSYLDLLRQEKNEDCGELWRTYKTAMETVSWSVVESRLRAGGPPVSSYDPGLDVGSSARSRARGVSKAVIRDLHTRDSSVVLQVPIGRGGAMKVLYLQVSAMQYEAVMSVLRGGTGAGAGVPGDVDLSRV